MMLLDSFLAYVTILVIHFYAKSKPPNPLLDECSLAIDIKWCKWPCTLDVMII